MIDYTWMPISILGGKNVLLKNRWGFIPNRYRQPGQYRQIFTNWVAVYRHPESGKEYHIQLNSYFHNRAFAKDISILVQCEDCRRSIGPNYTSIKGAIEALEQIFKRSN